MTARARLLFLLLFRRPWTVWATASMVVVAFAVTDTPARRAMWAGVEFQVAGIGTVLWSLHQFRLRYAPTGGVLSAIRDWGRAWVGVFPRQGRIVELGAMAGSVGLAGSTARLSVKAGPDATPKHRLDLLEREVEQLRDRFTQEIGELSKAQTHLLAEMGSEKAARAAEDQRVDAAVKEHAIGGLTTQFAGLWWLVIGVVLGTAPAESAHALTLLMHLL